MSDIHRVGFAYNPTKQEAVGLSVRGAGWCARRRIEAWTVPAGDHWSLVRELKTTDVLVVLGGDGTFLRAARALHGLASNAGIDACILTPPGAHNFDFWTQAFQNSLPWLSWKLKLTPQPSSVPAQCVPGKG